MASSGQQRRRSLTAHARARLEPYRLKLRKKYKREVNTVYARPLTERGPMVPTQGTFCVVPADEDNLARLKATYPKELNDRKYGILRHRVQDPAEDVWLTVDDNGELCGFGCLAWQDHEVKLMGHWVRVRPHQALFMDAYVFRKHRRRGAHTASVAERIAIAAQRAAPRGSSSSRSTTSVPPPPSWALASDRLASCCTSEASSARSRCAAQVS